MARSRYAPDRGLTVRMTTVVFLLGLLYVLAIGALIAFQVSTALIVLIMGAFAIAQFFASDRIALYSMGGHEVSPEQDPELHAIIDRLCALADMPKPRVAVADTDMPNAFATGRSPKRAVVCVTSGIRRRLTTEELEGVLSHELSHVAHRDVAVMTIASFLGVLAGLVTRVAFYSELFGGGRGRSNNNQDQSQLILLAVMAISAIVYAVSFLLTMALSRYRELAADRAGALLTGQPSALASALTKVTGAMGRIPTQDLRRAEAFNAFFFTPAFGNGASVASLFSTHPSLEVRLAQLQKISVQLGQGA